VSETWLDAYVIDTEIWIENYTIVWRYRSKMSRKYVTISEMTFLSPSESELESIWIQLLPKPISLIVSISYKRQKQNNIPELFDYTLNKIRPTCEIMVLVFCNIRMKNILIT
jgi:hypothetical protein